MSAIKPRQNEEKSSEFEGEIRDFIRRDVTLRRHAGPPTDTPADNSAQHLSSLIERVSAASVAEIDRVIGELQAMRALLQSEGDRVRREITGYAGLSQSAVATAKTIADTLAQIKAGGQTPPRQE